MFRLVVLILLLTVSFFSIAQKGAIIETGDRVLDPNGDGYVSKTIAGFSVDGYDVDEFEFNMFGVPIFGDGEALNDISAGEPCGVTDLALDTAGYAIYAAYDDLGNLIFRFRLAGNRPSVEAYTILLDTDNLIGEEDPNSSTENPGFEIDITLIQRMGVYLFDIDGLEKCGNPLKEYPVETHQQKSIGGQESCGDEDYYIDFYVPFSDITALTGITNATDLRLAGVTNASATCAIDGKISDIGGVDDTDYEGCFSCAILDLVENQCPFVVDSLCNDCQGFPIGPTDPPVINKPVLEGTSIVSGTSDPEAAIYLELFGSDKILVDQDTAYADINGDWASNPLSRPLNLGDSIVVNALAAGRCASGLSVIGTNFALVAENQPPVIFGTKRSVGYFENQGILVLDDQIEITDDETTLDSAWIFISSGFNNTEDSITYVNNPQFDYEYSGPGYLKIRGALPLQDYIDQLRQVGYINDNENPDNTLRTIEFRVSDGVNTSQPYALNLVVNPVNDPPVITNPGDDASVDTLRFTISEDSTLAFCFDAYDIDMDDLSVEFRQLPGNGEIMKLDTGTNCYLYTPNLNYFGDDELVIEVCDNGVPVECTGLVVEIEVLPVNDSPVIEYDGVKVDTLRISTEKNTPVELCFTATDVEGDPVTLDAPAESENAFLSVTSDGLCVNIIPETEFLGEDQFTLQGCDNGSPALCDTVVIIVSVVETNENPIIVSGGVPADTLDFTTKANTPIKFCIETTDPNGDDVFIDQIDLLGGQGNLTTLDSTATIGGNPARCLAFVPGVDFVGETLFQVKACDTGNPELCDSVIVRVDVTPNTPPIFIEPGTVNPIDTLKYTIDEDSTLAFCFGLYDEEGNSIVLDLLTMPSNGILNPLDTGANCYLYKPDENYFGEDEIVFEACDDGFPEGCTNLVVEIEILPVNDPPVIEFNGVFSDTLRISTEKDTPVEICFTATDVEGDPVTLDPIAGSENGDLSISVSDLCLNIVPDTGFLGEDVVVVPICDNGVPSLCDTIVVVVNVIEVNSAPEILFQGNSIDTLRYVTRANIPVDVCIETSDPDNDDVVFDSFTVVEGQGSLAPTDSTLTIGSNLARCLEFTPGQDFVGVTILDVQMCDTGNPKLCDNVILKVDILPNTPPVFIDPVRVTVVDTLQIVVDEDTEVEFCFDVFDAENNSYSLDQLSDPQSGMLELVSGVDNCFKYIPNANYFGGDEVTFEACDDGFPQGCNTLVIVIEVLPVNDPPQVLFNGVPVDSLEFSTEMNQPLDLCLELTDVDDTEFNLGDIKTLSGMGTLSALDSLLTINGNSAECLRFEPGIDFTGKAFYDVEICDSGDPVLCANVIISIDVMPVEEPVNNPPRFIFDGSEVNELSFTINEGTQLDTCVTVEDPDGDDLLLQESEILEGSGLLESNLDTELCFSYVPPSNYFGTDIVSFVVCDTGDPQGCDTLKVVVEILPVNEAPVAVNDTLTISSGEGVMILPLQNDRDPEDEGLFIDFDNTLDPDNGLITLENDSTIFYEPDAEFAGFDQFEYTVCDNGIPQACAQALVVIEIVGDPAPLPLKVFEGISPNGDGVNDVWIIQGIEEYPNNVVRVFDQWNNLIYEMRGYNNDDRAWRGQATKGINSGTVGDGTYFYTVIIPGEKTLSGNVVVKR